MQSSLGHHGLVLLVLLGLCGFRQQASSLALAPRGRRRSAASGHNQHLGRLRAPTGFLEQDADPCACNFENTCTCASALGYMDCISKACASGDCECSDVQYHNSCVGIANTCGTELSIDCELEQATCTETAAPAAAAGAGSCECTFDDVCSCESALQYMECISTTCASGECECSDVQYHNSCVDIASTCTDLKFDCDLEKVSCEETTVTSEEASPFCCPISPPPWRPREEHQETRETRTGACSCEFKDECSCASTLEYLDCISQVCASGDCECSDVKYHNSCVEIANACSGTELSIDCELDKATCIETAPVPAAASFLALHNRTRWS